jgi:UDP-galactopyranose mutase
MDQIVGQALATFRRINESLPVEAATPAVRLVGSPAALAS